LLSESRWSEDAPVMNLRTRAVVIGLFLLFARPIHSQQTTAAVPSQSIVDPSTYPNSPQGLRLLLLDVLVAARSGDSQKVASFLKEMEIPDFQNWFTKTYGNEKGNSWAEPYGKQLSQSEADMQSEFVKLASGGGEVVTRRVNDAPRGGKGGLEFGLVHTAKQAVDYYYAEWKRLGGPTDSIGYFVFIDGKFRWDSNIRVMRIQTITKPDLPPPDDGSPPAAASVSSGSVFQPGKDGVGYPSCAYCPNPGYTQEARDAKFQGTVVLKAVIGPDGRAADISSVKKVGYGMDEVAIQGVKNWRFKPATGSDGKPVAVVMTIEVAFHLR
jgi:TonB family protein